MESFLKEQLKRIQELTARMSSLAKDVAELTSERMRQQEALAHSPFADVKDFRTYSSAGPRRQLRSTAEDSPRRRPRKRRSR